MYQSCTNAFCASAKIALFCKFWSVCWNVGFANVCNVCWLPKLSRRAEARGQNKIFIGAVILFYWFNLVIFWFFLQFNLAGNGGGMRSWRSDESLSVRPKLRLGRDSTCRIRTNPAMPYTTCCA